MLKKGKANALYNLHELMKGKVGKSRKKAISTIAKKRNISKAKARQVQALAIIKSI